MRGLVAVMMAICGAALLSGTPMRDIEDRAAKGEAAAIAALRDSAAAGSLRAMNFLGYLYWQGLGTRLDRDSALIYLRKASAAGDPKASANLGHLLLTGSPELQADTAEALRLLDYAAGLRTPSALRELADYFEENIGDSASAPAIKKVADAYSHGHILHYNYHKSIEYYNRAAKLGDTVSQRIISELLEIFPNILDNQELGSEKRKGISAVDSTGVPSCVAGVQAGIFFTTRMASASRSGSTIRLILMLPMEPSFLTVNETVTTPSIPLSLATAG